MSRSERLVPHTVMFAMRMCLSVLAACGPTETLIQLTDAGPAWDGGADAGEDGGTEIPLTLLRALPSHGPFSGDNTVILRGAGFRSSDIEVRFGEVTLPATDVRRIDPNRLEVVVPAAAPGLVDVELADGESHAILEGAYEYDAFHLTPSSGPPSGGTRLTLRAASALFDGSSTVSIDGAPCTEPNAVSPMELTCRTPAHALGRADVSVASGPTAVLEDAFLYENPFRSFGGLGGGPLEGTLTVLVRDAGLAPLEGATVIAGREGALIHRGVTGPDGTIVFTGDDLHGPVSVFAWERCHHHTGFVGADTAYVTAGLRLAYLGCGGGGGTTGIPPMPMIEVSGEAVFYDGREFPAPTFEWIGVPEPGPGEERVLYAALATGRDLLNGDGTSAMVSAPVRIPESLRGVRGFRYAGVHGSPESGAIAPFAVAGIENVESGEFVPYVAGLGRPVAVNSTGIEIRMDTPIEAGREIAVTVPDDVPVLGSATFGGGELHEVELDRMRVQARYAVPAVAAGLPVFLDMNGVAEANDVSGRLPVVTLGRQPSVAGSFALAEQELFVILTSQEVGFGWYDQPHTRTIARPARGMTRVEVTGFLDIAGFTAPSELGGPLPADRTVRWEVDGTGVSLQRVRVTPEDVFLEGTTVWYIYAHPSARAVTLPDDADELPPARYAVDIELYDSPGLVFETLDTRVADSLALRRTSFNMTGFVLEDR